MRLDYQRTVHNINRVPEIMINMFAIRVRKPVKNVYFWVVLFSKTGLKKGSSYTILLFGLGGKEM